MHLSASGLNLLQNSNGYSSEWVLSAQVPITSSDIERWDARGHILPVDLRKYAHTVRSRVTKLGGTVTNGDKRVLEGQIYIRIPRGRAPVPPPPPKRGPTHAQIAIKFCTVNK